MFTDWHFGSERYRDMPVKVVDLYSSRIGKGERKAQRGQRWSGPQGSKRYQRK
uniref:Uncharacterized protein n=1 Tax=Pseudomonas phage Cygsa01 TaxID=3138529 RepID=A0AAU6W3G7_9VIRU